MENLWILTEERPKNSVIDTILKEYSTIAKIDIANAGVKIKPLANNNKFTFTYIVEGVKIDKIANVFIKIVSGYSSFMDYMLIKQDGEPENHSLTNIVFLLEETKTSDVESRNTGIGQRASKFAYANYFCDNVPKYMLYNEETTSDTNKKPTQTNIFGTNMFLTQGIKFLGKNLASFSRFTSIDELVKFKQNMRLPNKTNVPILINKYENKITVSGRLSNPKDKGNIGHDPNIGTLTCIASSLRKLGWTQKIIITKHGVTQDYVNKNKNNKFLRICKMLNIEMEDLQIPIDIEMPKYYWQYAVTSEKVASILLHITCQYSSINGIYENHAGCERSYFKEPNGDLTALHKKDCGGIDNLLLPDIVLKNDTSKEIYLIEGKMIQNLSAGLNEIEKYDAIENEHIIKSYPEYKISRWITLFGGNKHCIPHDKVLLYLNDFGEVYINNNAPKMIKEAFHRIGL